MCALDVSDPRDVHEVGSLASERPRSKYIAFICLAFFMACALSDLRMHSDEYTLVDGLKIFSKGIPYPWLRWTARQCGGTLKRHCAYRITA
jgi:hypothetical protein